MTAKKKSKRKLSTKQVIRNHLRSNRGREIPLSEIHTAYKEQVGKKIGRTAISNAIKELRLRGEISSERRPLRHGRYTVIWLAGDNITDYYTHPDEVGTSRPEEKEEPQLEKYDFSDNDETIAYLLSSQYRHEELLEKIRNLNFSPFDLATKYIQPLLYEVGNRWEDSSLTTAQEHLITARVEKLVHDLIPQNPEIPHQGSILLCNVEGDDHNLSLLLLEMILANKYKIINLRRSLPIPSLIQFIEDLEENKDLAWIFISITLPTYLGTLNRQINAIRASFGNNHKIAVGGQGVHNYEEQVSAVDHVISGFPDFEAFIQYLTN